MDDLAARLARLAPEVEATFNPTNGSRRHRRRFVVAALAGVAAIGVVLAVAAHTERRQENLGTVAGQGEGVARVELSIAAPATVPVGTRLWVDITATNVGDATWYHQGGCAEDNPFFAAFVPASVNFDAAFWGALGRPGPVWDGASSLDEAIDRPATGSVRLGESAFQADCYLVGVAPGYPVPAGESATWRMYADLHVGQPTELPDEGRYKIVVETFVDGIEVRDEQPVQLVDNPVRVATLSATRSALLADPRIERYVRGELTPLLSRTLPVAAPTTLSWWQGAWELDIDPGVDRFRLRASADGSTVTDARVIHGVLPDDDPDAGMRPSGQQPDDVIPPP